MCALDPTLAVESRFLLTLMSTTIQMDQPLSSLMSLAAQQTRRDPQHWLATCPLSCW